MFDLLRNRRQVFSPPEYGNIKVYGTAIRKFVPAPGVVPPDGKDTKTDTLDDFIYGSLRVNYMDIE